MGSGLVDAVVLFRVERRGPEGVGLASVGDALVMARFERRGVGLGCFSVLTFLPGRGVDDDDAAAVMMST